MNIAIKEANGQQADGALAELVTRAEYDVQIATARRYPRSIKQFINDSIALVTLNEQVADDCIYALPRDGKTIEGPSARFAEIILHAWGHSRAGARIVNEDGRFITAQGVCHDLQSNTLISFEVRRRITKSNGARYNDDMIGVTGNAASSIALRNAITKVIPKALWEPIYQEARKVVMGDAKTLANRRAGALQHLQKFGATEEMVLKKLGVKGIEDITLDHLVALRGIATALKEGDTSVEVLFSDEKLKTINSPIIDNIAAGIAAEAAAPKPETAYDKETGEIIEQRPDPSPPATDLSTPAGTRASADLLLAGLEAAPQEERSGLFVAMGGPAIYAALVAHTMPIKSREFRDAVERLGVKMPEASA